MGYNIDMSIDQILGENQAAAVFDRFLPGMRARVEGQPVVAGMSVRKLAGYAKGTITEEVLQAMNSELEKIVVNKEEKSAEEMAELLKNQPLTKEAAEQVPGQIQTAVYPGRIWRDTNGRRIQAHGGVLAYEDGVLQGFNRSKWADRHLAVGDVDLLSGGFYPN